MIGIHESFLLESERPATVAATRILTPVLNVFLGSTAALSGLELMRHMLTLKTGDQRKVALVYIDTDDPPAPLVEFRRQYNNVFQEFPLRIAVPRGISEADRIDETDQDTFVETKVPQYFANGAGGIRNNGHVAASFHHQYIADILDRALVSISRLSADQKAASVDEIQANIVTFLGGGTGSGTIIDIAVMVRELLSLYQYKQRLNLFCMLPEPITGANPNDLGWRKSNATAGLLEILAYSRAAATTPVAGYKKYMRGKAYRLTNDPIANEVYLVGHSSMKDAGDTARIIGLDLFQRATDASGVGFLEHSKWVDRRTLGASDNRGLPTMFGTSCPLEVRFPVEETASAFALISASYLLPIIASYQPKTVALGDIEKREWQRKWRSIARLDASTSDNDPLALKLAEFRRADFENASQTQLDILWTRLERIERATEVRMKEIIALKSLEEQRQLQQTTLPSADDTSGGSLIEQRIQYLKRALQEYTLVLDEMKERDVPRVPRRPQYLEEKLIRQPQLPGIFGRLMRDYSGTLCEAYNERLRLSTRSVRQRFLEQLLHDLKQQAQELLNQALSWFRDTDADQRSKDLRAKGIGSMAWQGKLEYPHPHQRHIFDLETLRTQNGRNIAVERLYRWVNGGSKSLEENEPITYHLFVDKCVEYLARYAPTSEGDAAILSIDDQIAGRLADRVVDFFKDYYTQQFQDVNLLELLNTATPPPHRGLSRSEQIRDYLLEHLNNIRLLMRSLVAFEAQLWAEGLSTLDTSVYIGMHWREGSSQEELLNQTLSKLGPLTRQGQAALISFTLDPHRLQIAYGQHAISLNTIPDFYLEENSAMQFYIHYQNVWSDAKGSGLMPVHTSGKAQDLVQQPDALGYHKPLRELVIRRPFTPDGAASAGAANNNQARRKTTPPDPNAHRSQATNNGTGADFFEDL